MALKTGSWTITTARVDGLSRFASAAGGCIWFGTMLLVNGLASTERGGKGVVSVELQVVLATNV